MRPADAGVDTYTNICEKWTIEDLYNWHEFLDMKAEAERWSTEQQKRK